MRRMMLVLAAAVLGLSILVPASGAARGPGVRGPEHPPDLGAVPGDAPSFLL